MHILSHPPSHTLTHRADVLVTEMLKEKSIPLSQLPGRPKRWREKCFEILEASISNKYVVQH